jgi:predicted nucleic acid-binding protein
LTELVLLDACVLVPYNLSSLLLALAEEQLFEPRWSDRIFDEVERTLIAKMGRPPDKVAKRLGAMREAFPEAFVHGFEWMEPSLSCDAKDRHVLAAAIASNATTIVTTNLKDFPDEACTRHDVAVLHPERFLLDLLALDAGANAAAVMRDAGRKIRPPMTPQQLLAGVTDLAPTFANTIHQVILDGSQPTSDIPAYVSVPDEQTPVHAWGQHHNPEDPLHVAFAWWSALLDRDRLETFLRCSLTRLELGVTMNGPPPRSGTSRSLRRCTSRWTSPERSPSSASSLRSFRAHRHLPPFRCGVRSL